MKNNYREHYYVSIVDLRFHTINRYEINDTASWIGAFFSSESVKVSRYENDGSKDWDSTTKEFGLTMKNNYTESDLEALLSKFKSLRSKCKNLN